MVITSGNVVYYLLERGLISFDSVVNGDLIVADTSRRNRNFKLLRKHSPSYFVKQIQNWEPQAIATLQREAACYQAAQNNADFAPLAALMPRFVMYDPVRYLLIVELLPEAENLSEYHRRLGRFPLEVAALLGQVLGTYHRQAGSESKSDRQDGMFPKMIPWILSIHQQSAYQFNPLSAANSQLLRIVQQEPEFHQALDTLRNQWQFTNLIHGDMKWDNCIVYNETDQNNKLCLKVVDWELADLGDGYWDVGAIFQAYLSFWIMSIQIKEGAPPEQLIDLAQYPLEEMQPAIREFWKTYAETLNLKGSEEQESLQRSVKYGAARMIQTAFEYMYYSPQITPNVICLLQASINILTKPEEAIRHLLDM